MARVLLLAAEHALLDLIPPNKRDAVEGGRPSSLQTGLADFACLSLMAACFTPGIAASCQNSDTFTAIAPIQLIVWQYAMSMATNGATIGVSDHGGWAVLVTVADDGALLDRRRVELVDKDLPKIPHHSEAQRLPLDTALALIERVRMSVEHHAKLCLANVAMTVPGTIAGIALRECPALPPTVAERIKDYRAQNVADWVMYRTALAAAAEARHWHVFWYKAQTVLDQAKEALRVDEPDASFLDLRRSIGPPWSKDHKLAMAAAIVAARAR